jgi:hypothetical protein
MSKARRLAVDDQRYFRELLEGLLQEEGSTSKPFRVLKKHCTFLNAKRLTSWSPTS